MKCPKCNAWSLVKETRGDRRRRECANGHRFTTAEINAEDVAYLTWQRRVETARETLRGKGYLV